MYEYNKSVKSSVSDELINTYLLRPLAGVIVRLLYNTRITPNQVTVASTVVGVVAALFYVKGETVAIVCAGLLVTLKDVLDSADGQLARARQQYSRQGRFLDSIGDFIVNFAIFGAIGWYLSWKQSDAIYGGLAVVGFAGITFRVSYHVFYQASFLHLQRKYEVNRITEEVQEDDEQGDRLTLLLQRLFQLIYGWQDQFVVRLDLWSMGGDRRDDLQKSWYSDVVALRLSGLLGMGTELFLLTLCSLFGKLELYLWLNAGLMNAVLVLNLLYRRFPLRKRLMAKAVGFSS